MNPAPFKRGDLASRTLRILHLEDDANDRELIRNILVDDELSCFFNYAGNETEFRAALEKERYDLILSDFTLPGYDGSSALAFARSKQPETPYLFVSGTIGEERAIDSLRNGAIDYVLKTNLDRLLPAVKRALREMAERIKRKQAEDAMRQSDERFHEMAENMRDVFWIASPDDRQLIYVSPAFESIWGQSVAELHARPSVWMESILIEDRAHVLTAFAGLAEGETYRVEYRVRRPDATIRWVEDRGYPVRSLSGKTERAVGVVSDITDRKQLESQLRQSQKMEAIGQLAGGVAHDFNNLLTVIIGHAGLLLDADTLPPECAESLRQIHTAGERAANLTRQLLTFSRKQAVHPQPIKLNETVDTVVQMLRRVIGETIRLEIGLADALPTLQADPGMMEQILMNLAVNARDAMPRGGRLVIQTESIAISAADLSRYPDGRAGKFVCLRVTDTGCGIPPEVLPRIFEPFFTTKEIGKGTGLGLATVFGIIQQHQGWLAVSSRVNEGTVFEVFLPAASPATTARPAVSTETKIAGGSETILFVEDETPVREVAVSVLKKYGYRVLQATSGLEALEIWRWHGPQISLLITDMVMPDNLTGRELAEQLLSEDPQLEVIYTSGYQRESICSGFPPQAPIHFIPKPYQAQTLAKAVREALDRRHVCLAAV